MFLYSVSQQDRWDMNSASRDRYTVNGKVIGHTLDEAADWADRNDIYWRRNPIFWERDDDVEATDVDSDVAGILIDRAENAKTPDQVNAEALAQLKAYVDRELLKLRMELSLQIEGLGK